MKTWKKWLKRIAATVCAAAMCAAMLPATAFAAEEAKITSFSLERVIEVPDEVPETAIEGVNYEPTPEIPENGQVTLLYKVTVNADAEAPFKVEFDGGSRIYTSEAAIADNTFVLLDGSGTVTQYYIKNFTAEDVEDTKLNATATVEGATAYGMTGTLAEGVEASQTVSVAVVGESAEPEPEPEPRYTITGFTKELMAAQPTDPWFHGSQIPDGVDVTYCSEVTIPDGQNSVTVMYKLTVTGDPGAAFKIKDDGSVVDSNCSFSADSMTSTIPNDSPAIIYVLKTFTASDFDAEGNLLDSTAIAGATELDKLSAELDKEDGIEDGWYTIGQEPEEKVSYPGLEKWIVTEDGNVEMDDVAAGTPVKFELKSNVPDNLGKYITVKVDEPEIKAANGTDSYVLTFLDTLDSMFGDPTGFEVKIGDTVLTNEQYTLDLTNTHQFTVTLDLAALYHAGVITNDDIEGATAITVTYTATLSEKATANCYTNTAQVTYPDGYSTPDTVWVKTYAINVFKYDQNTKKGLEGAQFVLTQKGSDDTTVGSQMLTSDENGNILVDGLDAGNYELREIKAPEGYVCSDEVLEIVVSAENAGSDYTIEAEFANTLIPHTGGSGTMMYTIGGVAIIVLAGVLLVVYRKSRKKQDR